MKKSKNKNNILNKKNKKKKLDNFNHSKKGKETILKNNKSNKDFKNKTLKNSKKKEQKNLNTHKNIILLIDEEINDLPYESAIQTDKRSFCQYYISLLKTKHNIFFSFCYNKDYNSTIIKIDLFFISFSLFYTVNALFFTDETIHKIYENEGSFDIIYQLPKIIYSSLISTIIDLILKIFALYNDSIITFKKEKKNDINESEKSLNKKL